ncbi:MAG: glycosyltransferase family 2 protein, partial [Bacteroidales bacterium]|nr:glycosyltransferase family 2 protein [Bacteroidales bacterium]
MKKEDTSLISVIVPVYNAEQYLDSCIRSIVNQTFKDIEIILIDDGSSDNSYDIMMNWSMKDSRIKIYRQRNNGVTSARRNGVEQASSKWITFVDADDVLPSDALTQMISYVKDA